MNYGYLVRTGTFDNKVTADSLPEVMAAGVFLADLLSVAAPIIGPRVFSFMQGLLHVMPLRCDNVAAAAWASRSRAKNPAAAGGWSMETQTAEDYAGITTEVTRGWSALMIKPVTLL